ncbi:MAG TPA: AsmA family protein [Cellvibrio sp.]|nr:AsmA family protein [Cellvibrio sp.]
MAAKSALKITAYIVAFVISSIIILALLVDANMFKPRIQDLAAERGVALNMRGDVRWAFWPSIGLAVNEVSVADSDAPQKIIADIKQASFLVAFVPLMKGDFQVKHVLVDGAVIDLAVDEKGEGNWEKLIKKQNGKSEAIKPEKTFSVNSEELKLAIEKISLHNSQVTYTNVASGKKFVLKNINVDMDDVNIKGKPFDVNVAAETEITDMKAKTTTAIKTKLHTGLAIGEGFNSITLDDGDVQLELHAAEAAAIKLTYSLKLDDLKNNLSYQGKFAIPTTNLKQLMAAFGVKHVTANPKALSEFSLSSDVKGDKKHVALSGVQLLVDKTNFKGSLGLADFESKALAVDLQGDEMILDDYLAPKADEKAQTVATGTGDEPLIPVEMLRTLNADIKLSFNKLTFTDLALEKPLLTVNSKNGILRQQLNANAYSGTIHQKTEVDTRNNNPQLQFEAVLQGVEVAPLLKAKKLDENLKLTGAIEANARGQASGVSKNQIMESLTANSTFSGVKMRLAPLNIEQQFCKFIALVHREEAPAQTWNGYTELRELSGKITMARRVINIENLNAGVEKLLLGSNGNINLINGSYDFSLPLKLVRDATDTPTSITTSAQGCKVTSNYWAERSMNLLRCKGKYAEINSASDCRPDKDMLNALIKDFAAYKLKEKHGAKIEEKKSELIKKLDEKLGGEGAAQKAKDTLKNLFKKKEEKTE